MDELYNDNNVIHMDELFCGVQKYPVTGLAYASDILEGRTAFPHHNDKRIIDMLPPINLKTDINALDFYPSQLIKDINLEQIKRETDKSLCITHNIYL